MDILPAFCIDSYAARSQPWRVKDLFFSPEYVIYIFIILETIQQLHGKNSS